VSAITPEDGPSHDEVVELFEDLRRMERSAAKGRAAARGLEDLRVEVRELRESLATLVRLVRRIVETKGLP
jgi:5-bromo-4-chloroindolyl phosphate hydrolysis protein